MNRLLAAVFVTTITAPIVLFGLGVRPAVDENRAAADVARPNYNDLRDASWFAEIDQAFVDRLPLRDVAIDVDREIDERLFDSPTNDAVVAGQDGWQFLPASIDQPCLTDDELVQIEDEIRRGAAIAALAGIRLRVLFAPDKAAVVGALGCPTTNAERISRLASPVLISGYTALQAAPEPASELFFKTDSHWKSLGASYAARALIEDLFPGGWLPLELSWTRDYATDLSLLLGDQITEPEPIVRPTADGRVLDFGSEPVKYADGSEVPNLNATETVVAGGSTLAGHTVFLHDSFGWAMIGNLTPYFERSTVVRNNLLVNDYMHSVLATADTLVIERVQRSFAVGMIDFPLSTGLAESLLDRLPSTPLPGGTTLVEPKPGVDRYLVFTSRSTRSTLGVGDAEIEFTAANRRQAVHLTEPLELSDAAGFTVAVVDVVSDQ